ncbi:ribonuclease T2-like [Chytriomyces hyalinus]|nr:ribonuclease T2-like [Chytriomyces hyalinus]KAJ3255830.1 ribonuclease T2-like [Chytriomyces hyalinus]
MAPCIDPLRCPSYAVGCQADPFSGALYDSCCVSATGLFVFAQNFTTGLSYGPNPWTRNQVVSEIGARFTLHGLWADNCDGTFNGTKYIEPGHIKNTSLPDYDLYGCDKARSFENAAQVLATRPSKARLTKWMKTNWRAGDGDDSWFWSHEWSKHGTCTSSFNPSCYGKAFKKYDDFFDFMEVSIEVFKGLDMLSAFKAASIVPSDTKQYNITQLNAAHKAAFGVEGGMQCVKRDGVQYLSEVWTYMNEVPGHNFKAIAPIPNAFQSCKPDTLITFPLTGFKTAL